MTFEELDRLEELEFEETEKIRKKGIKQIVSIEKYQEYFNPSNCSHCMNYCSKNGSCKKNMPNIDPFYTKDNDCITDNCDEWDYVYTTIDED